jgi:putative ABC transport system permease protein
MMIEYGMEPFIEMSTKAFIPITQAGIILGISILISMYPLWHMHRLDPVKAMRR